MSDLISRQDAIDAVNAYLGLSQVSRTIQDMTSIQEILKDLPSAQPKIIYCEDCKYYMPQRESTGLCTWFSDVLKYGVGYNDYCSNAEKDGEHE